MARSAALTAALALADAQAERIEAGDIDGYLAGFEAYEAACLHAVKEAAAPDAEAIITLEFVHSWLMERAQGVLAELSRKLAALRAGHTTLAAYHPTVQPQALLCSEG